MCVQMFVCSFVHSFFFICLCGHSLVCSFFCSLVASFVYSSVSVRRKVFLVKSEIIFKSSQEIENCQNLPMCFERNYTRFCFPVLKRNWMKRPILSF